ncbi:GSCFA domain-containing protein [Acidisoma sp. L85]|uniref:GSCFA domain-containing protein n=1 Tax=Acidisoma sp. L85 TaxID=1641850 RepID=UPI00131AE491|nr:GSCFA domain-containing protein [Acidisoma sp. L85]
MQKIVLIGHSHVHAIERAIAKEFGTVIQVETVLLNELEEVVRNKSAPSVSSLIPQALTKAVGKLVGVTDLPVSDLSRVAKSNHILTVMSVGGNAHNTIGLLRVGPLYDFNFPNEERELVPGAERQEFEAVRDMFKVRCRSYFPQIKTIADLMETNLIQLEAPPPKKDDLYIIKHLDPYFQRIVGARTPSLTPSQIRLKLWRLLGVVFSDVCNSFGVPYLESPKLTRDPDGFLLPEGYGDATHANEWYARHVIEDLLAHKVVVQKASNSPTTRLRPPKASTPYSTKNAGAFWKASVAETDPTEVDPVDPIAFRIEKDTKIVTAGSCFAQHIAKRLQAKGFSYYITETAHPIIDSETAERFNFGTFSARYGNIYTSRQLDQLFDRAYGVFKPVDEAWSFDGGFVDPFRPRIQPNAFTSKKELLSSRETHLAAVRRAFEGLDLFVFTMGLTECWSSKVDGAVFPLCPGVAGGVFDDELYGFHNLTVDEVIKDMKSFISKLRTVNPNAAVLLTVSPVPLIATATDKHILNATSHSKAVLRVSAEVLQNLDNVFYFPSYEIVTGGFSRGRYFGPDLREISEAGVDHVMKLFFRHLADVDIVESLEIDNSPKDEDALRLNEKIVNIICDEEALLTE